MEVLMNVFIPWVSDIFGRTRRSLQLALLLPIWVTAACTLTRPAVESSSVGNLQKSVVRVTSSVGGSRTGSGFVVRREPDAVYIVTASHVVEGDKHPNVEFFNRQHLPVIAEVPRIEGGDPKGLALLIVRSGIPPDLEALPLADSDPAVGSDNVKVIGFPAGGGPWAVLPASIVSRDGRDLVLSGNIDEGNSGGPVVRDGRVIGIVHSKRNNFGVATPTIMVRETLSGWGIDAGNDLTPPATATPALPAPVSSVEQRAAPEAEPRQDTAEQAPAPSRPASPTIPNAVKPPSVSGKTFRDCPQCPEMVSLPAGTFVMGSPPAEPGRNKDEGPQHSVTIKPFALGKYEITRDQYEHFASDTRRRPATCMVWDGTKMNPGRTGDTWQNPGYKQTGNDPVVCIDWSDAFAYTQWLSAKTGQTYRLPSEAEWEYAARAGKTSSRFWGDAQALACRYANIADQRMKTEYRVTDRSRYQDCSDGYAQTAPVGRYLANDFGLHDVLGNAWEWTADCHHDSYLGAPTDGAAWQGADCKLRVVRGGSWYYYPLHVRSAYRNHVGFDAANSGRGFRVARELD